MLEITDTHGLIPHAGKMRLLDRILTYDDEHIVCSTTTHMDSDNPLRVSAGLSAIHGIEYGAQAMAWHGALSGEVDRRAYIATVRDIEMYINFLDNILGPLRVTATVLFRNDAAATYRFSIGSNDGLLVLGRLTAAFMAEGNR